MARKQSNGAVTAAAPESKGQVSIITLKGTAAYREWLSAQSKRTHIPATSIVRLGLAAWAKENGVVPPPEK
jgi:hypothetical protein